MALFPSIELESETQIADKIRLNASQSFVSKGSPAITIAEIKPGEDQAFVPVFDANDKEAWYLDWSFLTVVCDINDLNNKIDFSEGGTIFEATIPTGTYTLPSLLTAVGNALDTAGANDYTATIDSKNIVTIEANGTFGLLPYSGDNKLVSALEILGFVEDTSNKAKQSANEPVDWLPRFVTCRIGDGVTTAESTKMIKVFTEAGDRLFSEDSDLVKFESDILKWVSAGRSTFLNVHRKAQQLILNWLDKNGYVNSLGKKYSKHDIYDFEEVRDWSTYMVLKMIFSGIYNATSDVFSEKSKYYLGLEKEARSRLLLRIDVDKDGKADFNEGVKISSGDLIRE